MSSHFGRTMFRPRLNQMAKKLQPYPRTGSCHPHSLVVKHLETIVAGNDDVIQKKSGARIQSDQHGCQQRHNKTAPIPQSPFLGLRCGDTSHCSVCSCPGCGIVDSTLGGPRMRCILDLGSFHRGAPRREHCMIFCDLRFPWPT